LPSGSGSDKGSGAGTLTFGGFGGANDFGLPNAVAGAPDASSSGSSPPSRSARRNALATARDALAARPSDA
jgi:hypothetical protein